MVRIHLALALVLLPATPGAFQRARFVPGGLDPAKARLLGFPGAVLPESGALGPFADLDGDGDVDFLHGASLQRNDGAGVFRRARALDLAEERRIGFFDANGDGRCDLLSRTHLYLGTSSGDFADATSDLPVAFVADAGVLADFDGDLDVDVLAIERWVFPGPARVRLALNDGAGHFLESSLPAFPTRPWTAVAGDVDGDADLDLVLATWFDAELLWLNDGAGGFTLAAGAIPATSDTTYALALADLDADLDLDLVVGNRYTPNRLLWNDGGGLFMAGTLPPPPQPKQTDAILVLDREGDGDPDLVFLDSFQQNPTFFFDEASAGDRLLENDGSGVFSATTALPAFSRVSRAGFAGDLDGDGDADLLVEASVNRIFWNDGTGSFAVFPRPSGSGSLGDLNGDGLLDAFSVFEVQLNGPPGVFTVSTAALPAPPLSCWDGTPVGGPAALGDVDGDGDLDAYIAIGLDECGVTNELWVNDGVGVFADETSARLPTTPAYLERTGISMQTFLLALDGDGDLDAACVRSKDSDGGGFSSSYLNDGMGVFTSNGELGGRTRAGAFGDLDGDGDADYFEGSFFFEHENDVYRNDGSALFVELAGALPAHALPLDAGTVALGDVDGDGDLDAYVATTSSTAPSLFLYVNDGTAHFGDEPGRIPQRVHGQFVDLDLDGDVDLLGDGLLINDGRGSFTEASARLDPLAFAFAPVDVDLDGDPDSLTLRGLARHLEALGEPRIGKRHTFVVHGPAHRPFVLRQSLASAQIDLGAAGWLLIDPTQIVSIDSGTLDRDGEARVRHFVPPMPALIGFTSYWQAVVGTPVHGTNLAVTTVSGL